MKGPDGQECSTWPADQKIALSGKHTTTLYLLNPEKQRVEKIEVDGCAITQGLRCDWLVRVEDGKEEIFVELKGSDVSRAIKQLTATIGRLSTDPTQLRKRCFVVFNRNPLTGTDVQKHKVRFLKSYNAAFRPVRNKTEIRL